MNKVVTLANFNCTFGKDNRPMLEYFNNIIFPAFQSGYIRKVKEDEYFFDNVRLEKIYSERYALVGILIRKTKLEVKTEYDRSNGLQFKDKYYDTAPISIFTIFLDNHRMTYTKNQKGSPDIRSFNATVNEAVENFIKNRNRELSEGERLPFAIIDIVNLPSEASILQKLREVEKIRTLKFKLFNPNGDFNIGAAYEQLTEQLGYLGANKGTLTINSPSNFNNVAKVITETKGLAEAKLDVKYKSGSKGTIDHASMGEKITLNLPEVTSSSTVNTVVVNTLKDKEELKYISEDNEAIYMNNLQKIEELL